MIGNDNDKDKVDGNGNDKDKVDGNDKDKDKVDGNGSDKDKVDLASQIQCVQSWWILLFFNFSAHDFSIVNSLRQIWHDAGGFSYKSMRTLQELFPLINSSCKFSQIAHTKNI